MLDISLFLLSFDEIYERCAGLFGGSRDAFESAVAGVCAQVYRQSFLAREFQLASFEGDVRLKLAFGRLVCDLEAGRCSPLALLPPDPFSVIGRRPEFLGLDGRPAEEVLSAGAGGEAAGPVEGAVEGAGEGSTGGAGDGAPEGVAASLVSSAASLSSEAPGRAAGPRHALSAVFCAHCGKPMLQAVQLEPCGHNVCRFCLEGCTAREAAAGPRGAEGAPAAQGATLLSSVLSPAGRSAPGEGELALAELLPAGAPGPEPPAARQALRCPCCHQAALSAVLVPQFQQFVEERLDFACPFHAFGCEFRGHLPEILAHLPSCAPAERLLSSEAAFLRAQIRDLRLRCDNQDRDLKEHADTAEALLLKLRLQEEAFREILGRLRDLGEKAPRAGEPGPAGDAEPPDGEEAAPRAEGGLLPRRHTDGDAPPPSEPSPAPEGRSPREARPALLEGRLRSSRRLTVASTPLSRSELASSGIAATPTRLVQSILADSDRSALSATGADLGTGAAYSREAQTLADSIRGEISRLGFWTAGQGEELRAARAAAEALRAELDECRQRLGGAAAESARLGAELREAGAHLQEEVSQLRGRLEEQEGERAAAQQKSEEIHQRIALVAQESERLRARNAELEAQAAEKLLAATECAAARAREQYESATEVKRLRDELAASWDATAAMRSERDALAAQLEKCKAEAESFRNSSAQDAAETSRLVMEIVRDLNARLSQGGGDAGPEPGPAGPGGQAGGLAGGSFTAEGEWGGDFPRQAAHKRVASESVGLGRWFGPDEEEPAAQQSEALVGTPGARAGASPHGISPVQKAGSPTSPLGRPTLSPTFPAASSGPGGDAAAPIEPLQLRELDDSFSASSRPSTVLRGEASALLLSSRRANLQQDVVALTVLRYLYSSKRVLNTSRLARFVNYLRDLLRKGLDLDRPAEVRAGALTDVMALLQHFYCGDIELADYFDFLKNYEVERSVVMKQSFGISAYNELFKEVDLSRKEAARLRRILDENGIPYDASYRRYKQEKLRQEQARASRGPLAGRAAWASGALPPDPRLSGSLSARGSRAAPLDQASARYSMGVPSKAQINAMYNSQYMGPNPYYASRPSAGDRRQTSAVPRPATARSSATAPAPSPGGEQKP